MPTLKLFWRSRIFIIVSFLIFHCSRTEAQCPITVDAGPDQTACAPSGTATLQGNITGTYLGFNWDPIIGLSDPNSLNPMVTVTGPQTYTLTASAADPLAPNLVNNPAFENGASGYTTQLVEDPAPITPGTYTLTTSPSIVNSNFPPCDDHTFGNGTGFMMLVNGPAVAGTQVWCQNIPVMPNTWYTMSAWATASPISPPELQFSVNGQLIGLPYLINTNPCNWQEFTGAWFSGPATSVDFCIIDQNGSGLGLFGDDFALDDVFFGEACTVTDDVDVTLVDVMAVLDPTVELPCNALPAGMVLDGSGSTAGPNVTYQWTTSNGSIVSGGNTAMPTINMEGMYTLTVTYNDGIALCTDQATIQVLPDPNVVFAMIVPPDELNCDNPTVTIDASPSSSGPTISYLWLPAANILTGGNSQFPVVNMGGTYTLTVTNSISGCTATETVFVFENFNEPTVGLIEPDELTCVDTLVTLSGSGSSTGSEFIYTWTTSDGNIVSGSTTLDDCVVDSEGNYTLTVTNTENGCTADTLAMVIANADFPTAVASAPNPIGCGGGSVPLSGSGSSTGSQFEYLWTTSTGNILSGETTLDPTVDASAEYLLTVTNLDNECSSSDSTFLSENTTNLMAEIAEPDTLDCVLLLQNLDATSSTVTPDMTISWTGPAGALADITLTPEINTPGTYTLTLTDDPTGCTSTTSVEVFENVSAPTAEAGPAMTIDCDADPVTLNGSGSGNQYAWTTSGGNILSGETTPMAEVNAVGVYYLTVTDGVNGCTAVDSTMVNQTGDAPEVNLVVDDILDCEIDTLAIDGSGSTSGPQILIEWTTSDGSFAGGENTLNPDVDGAGTYTLTLTDQSTGCVGSGSIEVEIDTLAPLAIIAPSLGLDCVTEVDTLDATASSQGAFFNYSWSAIGGGQILSGSNTLEPVAGAAGVYVLTVLNWENACFSTESILVNGAIQPTAEAGQTQTLDCDITTLNLNGNGTGGAIQWTTSDGNILTGDTTLTPTIDEPGVYVLTVGDVSTGCVAIDSVDIDESADLPAAIIEEADSLDCAMTSIFLSGNGSSSGLNFTYLWTTSDGNFAAGETTLSPEVDAPGTYLLTVTDTSNNCMATEEVTVFQNGDLPTAEAGMPDTLSCLAPELQLSGSVGGQFEYLWTTTDGNILSGEMTLTPTINASGTYTLTVTDTSNGCTASDEVTIEQDADSPTADAGLPDTLTCLVTELDLNGMGSSTGAQIEYLWTTSDGNIMTGATTLTPAIDEPGTYLLTVTDQSNDCESIASVTIAENTSPPDVQVVSPVQLTCLEDTLILQTEVLSGTANYIWFSLAGGIISGDDTPNPVVNLPDIYLADVVDSNTGCMTAISIEVVDSTQAPDIFIDQIGDIDCGQSDLELSAVGSSSGPGFDHVWTAQSGQIISGGQTLNPTVALPGTYVLEITNISTGCSASEEVMINATIDTFDAVIVLSSDLNCLNDTVTLDGASSNVDPSSVISWQTQDGNFAAGQNTLAPQVDEPGIYVLIIENPINGCSDTASVTVFEDIDPPGADAGADTWLSCDEPEIALWGTSPVLGVNFLWETQDGNFLFGTNGSTPGVDAAGTYLLTVTNPANGCTSEDEVVVSDERMTDFFFESTAPGCAVEEGSIAFTGVNGGLGWVEFSIDGGASFASQMTYENLLPGTYDLVVVDSGGCLLTDVVFIEVAAGVEVSLPQIINLNLGDSQQLTPSLNVPESEIANAVWSPADGLSCADCLSPVATPSPDAEYLLTVTDVNGCTASASVSFVLASPTEMVYVPNVFSPNGDGINDEFLLYANPSVVKQVRRFLVFSRWGESVFEAYDFLPNDFDSGWDGTHRGDELDGGVFAWFAEIEMANGEIQLLEGEVSLLK